MNQFEDAIRLEKSSRFDEALNKWKVLYQSKPTREVYLRYLYLNWHLLTLVHGHKEKKQNYYRDNLEFLYSEGVNKYSNDKMFLCITSILCNEFFFYLFGLANDPSDDFIKKANSNYPGDELVKWFTALKKRENQKMNSSETKMMLKRYFPENSLMDKYFMDFVE